MTEDDLEPDWIDPEPKALEPTPAQIKVDELLAGVELVLDHGPRSRFFRPMTELLVRIRTDLLEIKELLK